MDCIKKSTSGGNTTYKMYLNRAAAIAVQDSILDIVNSNEAAGVLDVNNNFDSESFEVKESEITIIVANGKIVSVDCETELRYTPVAGEYTEYTVTLKNSLKLIVNEELSKAQAYEAPSKADGILSKLSYIL